jgi:2-polyprenyl-3-methyl-5-hydroxy-6-metoxy-1,4-benzoquinol methylase
MTEGVALAACICCGHSPLVPTFAVSDHAVSGESFRLLECSSCGFRCTEAAPDAAHIGPYYASDNYISHTNTNKGIVNRLYQWARHFTLRQKRSLVVKTTGLQQGSLLEVGAGTGFFAEAMIRAGWQVTALEPDPGARRLAKERAALHLQPAEELYQLPAASFDVITLWHVLEHVHDLSGYLQQFHRLLRPHGWLIVAVPNYQSTDAAHYGAHWAAYDVPRHLYHFSPDSMNRMLASQHFKLSQLRPMWLDAFYVSLLSEKYKSGHTRLLAGIIAGAMSNLTACFDKRKTSSLIYLSRKQ